MIAVVFRPARNGELQGVSQAELRNKKCGDAPRNSSTLYQSLAQHVVGIVGVGPARGDRRRNRRAASARPVPQRCVLCGDSYSLLTQGDRVYRPGDQPGKVYEKPLSRNACNECYVGDLAEQERVAAGTEQLDIRATANHRRQVHGLVEDDGKPQICRSSRELCRLTEVEWNSLTARRCDDAIGRRRCRSHQLPIDRESCRRR